MTTYQQQKAVWDKLDADSLHLRSQKNGMLDKKKRQNRHIKDMKKRGSCS